MQTKGESKMAEFLDRYFYAIVGGFFFLITIGLAIAH